MASICRSSVALLWRSVTAIERNHAPTKNRDSARPYWPEHFRVSTPGTVCFRCANIMAHPVRFGQYLLHAGFVDGLLHVFRESPEPRPTFSASMSHTTGVKKPAQGGRVASAGGVVNQPARFALRRRRTANSPARPKPSIARLAGSGTLLALGGVAVEAVRLN